MQRWWKWPLGAALVIPLMAYVTGSLAAAESEPIQREPLLIMVDPADAGSPEPTPSQQPSEKPTQQPEVSQTPETVRPTPNDLDEVDDDAGRDDDEPDDTDADTDNSGRGSDNSGSGHSGSGHGGDDDGEDDD